MKPIHALLGSFGVAFIIGCLLVFFTKFLILFPIVICIVIYLVVKYLKRNEDGNAEN